MALLKETPQAVRLLRPLLRMLLIELPPELQLPPRKPPPKPAASPAVADAPAPTPDAASAAPRGPGPGARPAFWPRSPELARLSDEELARRIAEARASLPLIPKPDQSDQD